MNTDNQQQTVSDFEIGWMAGLVEGEGSIVLQIHKRNNRSQNLRITPRVIVTNSDEALINKYIEILTRLGIGKYVRHTRPNNRKVSELFKAQGRKHKFKDMTWVNVEGFKRVSGLLTVITPHLFGEKKQRALLLLRFILGRLIKAKRKRKARNYSYDNEDIGLMLEFLSLTKTPNYNKIAGMLNEHTQEAKREKRRKYKRDWRNKNKDRINKQRRLQRSRCALDSREIVRDKQKCLSAI